MKRVAGFLGALALVLGGVAALGAPVWARQPLPPLERYRNLEFPPIYENFDRGWQERVALEFEIVNTADLASLRAGLQDANPYVRAMSARVLGFLSDRVSADALAAMAAADPEYLVRIRAVEALGFLKSKPEAIERAKKDPDPGVQWSARTIEGLLTSEVDYAAQARQAYAEGIRREAMGSARVGRPAPDFTARTSTGQTFRLSQVLGKKPIAIYFAAFDG
jgi:hypothetical protein